MIPVSVSALSLSGNLIHKIGAADANAQMKMEQPVNVC